MKAPFDIAGDLDTPVSAYMKLRALRPSFLLESVEGGERLGRYSFIGFGDALELRLDTQGLWLAGERHEAPHERTLEPARRALAPYSPRPCRVGHRKPPRSRYRRRATRDLVARLDPTRPVRYGGRERGHIPRSRATNDLE